MAKVQKTRSQSRKNTDPNKAVPVAEPEVLLDGDAGDEEDLDSGGILEPEVLTDDDDFQDADPLDGVLRHEETDDGENPSSPMLPVPARRSSTDSLHQYLQEIGKFPLLTPEEEYRLARQVQDDNDPQAAFRIVSAHLRLVVKIAMDFQRRWMQNVLDLIQEGNVGLMRAVHKFDPEKGIKFSYYAAFWIKAYILKFIMDNWRMVKIGTTQAQRKLFYNLNKERQKLIAQGFDPDAKTLSKNLNVSENQVLEMEQRMDGGDVSLDAPLGGPENNGASRMEMLPALGPGIENVLADSEIADLVRDRLKTIIPLLSEKESYILTHRLLTDDPVTLREIGEKYNITRERVRQIEARLLQKVKDHFFREIKDFSEDWITPE